MGWIASVWNNVMSMNIVEPTVWAWALFFFIFIVCPIFSLWVGIKLAVWFFELIRDWWHEGMR